MRPFAARTPCSASRPSGTRTGRPCGTRGATAGDPSRCAACRARSCWCGGRSRSARPSAAPSARPPRCFLCTHWWRRVEAPRVTAHRDQARLLLHLHQLLGVLRGCPPSGSRCARACRPSCTGCPASHASASASPEWRPARPAAPAHSPRSVVKCGMPYFCATSRVESRLPPASDTISTSGMFFSASMCLMPKAP